MKSRSTRSQTAVDVATLTRELVRVRAELDERKREGEQRRRLDAVSTGLVGELDRARLLERAERLATAALGRPCVVSVERPAGDAVPIGPEPASAWLTIADGSPGISDDDAAREVAERIAEQQKMVADRARPTTVRRR
jgi:hypothetical protein